MVLYQFLCLKMTPVDIQTPDGLVLEPYTLSFQLVMLQCIV